MIGDASPAVVRADVRCEAELVVIPGAWVSDFESAGLALWPWSSSSLRAAPRWAVLLYEACPHDVDAAGVLRRCAADGAFRDALLSVLVLSGADAVRALLRAGA